MEQAIDDYILVTFFDFDPSFSKDRGFDHNRGLGSLLPI